MLLQDSHLTFGKIADKWAREAAAMPGGLARDEILHELLKAVWRGEFEDEDGNTVLMLHRPPPGGAWRIDGKFVDKDHMRTAETKPVEFNRRMLLCVLAFDCPHGLTLPPGDRLRDWHSPESDNPEPVPWSELKAEIRWDILDALTMDEYTGTFLWAYLEALTISKDDFGRWRDEQGRKRPRFWFDDDDKVVVESTDKKVVGKAIDAQAERKSQTQDVAVEERMPRQIGRPSLRQKIEAAYQDLKDAGGINFDEPKAALCKPIREKVHQSLGGDAPHKGLRDGAILKWIRPLFDNDKTAHDAQSKTTS